MNEKHYSEIMQSPNRPTIGVVVSSGGPKAFAAVELFRFLEDEKIPIDLFCGASGGAVVCAMKANGALTEEVRELILTVGLRTEFKFDPKAIASLLHVPFMQFKLGMGVLKQQGLLDSFRGLYGADTQIESLKTPLLIQATNLRTGAGVTFEKGLLYKCVYASSAAIPVLPPIQIEGEWYVDAFYSSAVPVMPAVAKGIDIIIVMDVQPFNVYQTEFRKVNNQILDYFNNFLGMTISNTTRFQNSLAVDQHHHEIIFIDVPFRRDYAIWEADKITEIFSIGKEAVEKMKGQIISAIETFIPRKK